MKDFTNTTTDGNEKALKRGVQVPDGAVNLAWAKAPKLSPQNNSVVIDTSQTIAENAFHSTISKKIYYANALGILEDEHGNQIVEDEFPVVGDIFSVDEDFLNVPGSEYSAHNTLPYVHVSRFFHVDFPGLTLGSSDLRTYDSSNLKIIDENGRHYVDENGKPRYRIKITPAYSEEPSNSVTESTKGVYRVWAFVDTNENENLYLFYNKVELSTNALLKNQDINHKEILNPQPYFYYKPEESDVVDPVNRNEKWYSTKPVDLKEKVLVQPRSGVEGYRIFVPKKAIPDPRIFQLFRWRLSCDFVQSYTVDITRDEPTVIRCGVVVTNSNPTSAAPYAFYNIEKSNYNATGAVFVNPIQSSINATQDDIGDLKTAAAYWYVNMDTVTEEQLRQFDILLWVPRTPEFDFTPYLGKMDYFSNTLNKLLVIDLDNFTVPTGLGIVTTKGRNPRTGNARAVYSSPTVGTSGTGVGTTTRPYDASYIFFDANEQLGGWDFNDSLGRNLIENNGFEEGTGDSIDGWAIRDDDNSLTVERSTEEVKFGTRSAKLTNAAGTDRENDYIYTTVSDLAAKTKYVFSAYCFVDTIYTEAPEKRGLFVVQRDPWKVYGSSKLKSNFRIITDIDLVTVPEAGQPPGMWVRHQVVFKTSDDPGVTEFRLYAPQGTVYWDAVQLEEATVVDRPMVDSSFEEPDITFERDKEPMVGTWRYRDDKGNALTVERETEKAHTGTACVKLTSTKEQKETYLHKLFDNVKPNTKYIASAWVRVKDFEGPAIWNRGLFVVSRNPFAKEGKTTIKATHPKHKWVKHEVAFETGEDPGLVEVRLYAPKGTVFWDDLRFEEKTSRTVSATDYNASTDSTDEYDTITPYRAGLYGDNGYVQYINSRLNPYDVILEAENLSGDWKPLVVFDKSPSGSGGIMISTTSTVTTVSRLFSNVTGKRVSQNTGSAIFDSTSYDDYINSHTIEGAMKFFFNTCLFAVSNTQIDNTDQITYTTRWSFSTPWKPSWVIDADNNVLSEEEKTKNNFTFMPNDDATPQMAWQRKLVDKTAQQLIDESLNDVQKSRLSGSSREYRLEITNSLVDYTESITDNTFLYAWTDAYTPAFTVPANMGPYVVREDPVQGEYTVGQYAGIDYPPRPYGIVIGAKHKNSESHLAKQEFTWTAQGNARYRPHAPTDTELRWSTHGGPKTFYASDSAFAPDTPLPNSILTYQYANYHDDLWGGVTLSWPHYGFWSRLEVGSRGEEVMFVQDALNRFASAGVFTSPYGRLKVDGIYELKTAYAVGDLQTVLNARTIDSVVDAETWGLIGNQILALGNDIGRVSENDHTRFFKKPKQYMALQNISDFDNVFAKRSQTNGGPSLIWETFAMRFDDTYKIHAISLTPYVPGQTKTMIWDSIHVMHSNINAPNLYHVLNNYNSSNAQIKGMNRLVRDGVKEYIPFGPYSGDTIIVGVGQDKTAGIGTARALGIRELVAHAQVSSASHYVNIVDGGTLSVTAGQNLYVKAQPHAMLVAGQYPLNGGNLVRQTWETVEVDNENVVATINEKGRMTFMTNVVDQDLSGDNFTSSGNIPAVDKVYYAMSEDGVMHGAQESGWISKKDGIKLICTADGKPFGFPEMPTDIGPNEAQQHYSTLVIERTNNDPSIFVGFYDFAAKEFVVNSEGIAEMSYIEYITRGPDNIYAAVMCNYEVDAKHGLPSADDAPPIPFRWAMPVYGVHSRSRSHIGLEPLPPNLGVTDIWPVPVKTGHFNKFIRIRDVVSGPISGWPTNYQGKTLNAFYSVPEADLGGWSEIYGRPYKDVRNETPLILEDDVIQVLQAPIYVRKEPTAQPSAADPWRPVFTVYTRANSEAQWDALDWTEIKDYNTSDGTIYLVDPLPSTDADLVKVEYTSARTVFDFKQYNGNPINLNPYAARVFNAAKGAVYIYIVPTYVMDENGATIPESVQERTLRFTSDNSIFDRTSPTFDPLAVQLGVIYIDTALELKDLVLMDTRRRGGGVRESLNKNEISRLVQEASSYWDMDYGAGMAYQKGGFVIIRLPAELKDDFPDDQEIIDAIDRNIPAGVQYIIEDMNGRAWSSIT